MTFENTTGSQQRADPGDFRLREQRSGNEVAATFAAAGDCRRWQRADLYPAHGDGGPLRDSDARPVGAVFGPVALCFKTAAGTDRLFLHWEPDIGLLGGDLSIPLRG